MSSPYPLMIKQVDNLPTGIRSIIDQLPVESRLLLHMMRPQLATDNAAIDDFLMTVPIRWDELIRLGRRHGAMPLFYRNLRERPDRLVPPDIKALLRNDFHRIGLLITMQIEALSKVLAAFNSAELPLLFFKGIQLGQQAYKNPIWRKPGDLDILIHTEHFGEAKELLIDLGFSTRKTEVEEKEQIDRQQQLTFFGTTTDVDVHCSLQQRSFLKMSYASTFDSEDVWKRAMTIDLDGLSIPCLSPEDQFCLLCIHSAKHGWYRLYMLADIAAFMANVKLNWQKIAIRAKRLKAERMLGLSVLLVNNLFEMEIPAQLQKAIRLDHGLARLAETIVRRLFDDQAENKPFQFHRIQAGLFPSWSEKALYFGYVTAEHLRRMSSAE